MKYIYQKNNKNIFLILSILLVSLFSLNITTNSYRSSEEELNSNQEDIINIRLADHNIIYTLNGKEYLAEYITEEKVQDLKKDLKFDDTGRNDKIIIDGHGTGYSFNSEEDLDSLIGKISILELISDNNRGYKATADISTEIYFPVVGDQGMQGSCTSWANVYYAYGYLEAKDYGWDASSGDPQYLLSPAWSYNKIAAYDYGSVPSETAELIKEWGVSTLITMPYDDTDVDSWGGEDAWREAPYHRPLDYTLITYVGYSTIDVIKSLLDSGTPVTIGIDAYQYSNGLDDGMNDYILSSDEYNPSGGLNHAQCFVGYDDSISEGSDVGAFRVVNSWGDSWMDNGFYWLTYDAFNEFGAASGQEILFITDQIDYNPNIIATWEFSSAPTRMSDIITLGVGPHGSPLDMTNPHYDSDINNLFPEFMAFDISDFYSYYLANNDELFYLEIGSSDTTGIISSFKLERYSGGILQQISQESPDTPKATPGHVIASFMSFDHELKTILTVPTNPLIYNSYSIKTMVLNNGLNTETSISFELFLNGVSVHSITIPSLPIGANTTITFLWTPTEYDIYNFTAYSGPVPGEIYLLNNEDTKILYILAPIFHDDFESGLSKWVSITGLWHLTDDTSVWSNPYHSPRHSMWFGNESTGNYETGLREIGDLISTPFNLTDSKAAFLEFYHWREGEGYGWDISYVYISIDGINWDLIYETDEYYVSPWEKVSLDISAYKGNDSVQLLFKFDTIDSVYNDYRGWLVDDIAVMGTGVEIPHNLRVSLDIPEKVEISNTYTVNATITNIGTSDETDIDLFLYEDGIIVDSLDLSNLLSGSSQTINYLWTPTEYGLYNFTAYAPPVPGEEWTFDNLVTEMIPLHEVTLFDGMYINYTFSITTGYTGPAQVSYTQISDSRFHVFLDSYLSGIHAIGNWDVYTQTRIMENSSGNLYFGDGLHTPIWIFTDISMNDKIFLSVFTEGDHEFNVSGEIIYDIPGFGPVEAWKLEDLTLPGGLAYYEKKTGILLSGIIFYSGGMYSYTFDFISTNAAFNKIVFDHNLRVNLDTPLNCELYNTYTINATIINTGTNNETDVDLYLYLDDVIVDSIYISDFPNGSSETISFLWTPTEYGLYNFTAYSPSVVGETYITDNLQTKLIGIYQTFLFDGMVLNYLFTLFAETYSIQYSYSYLSEELFHVDYIAQTEYGPQAGFWDVNIKTRIMTNAFGGISFGSGTHTPLWIFTEISLYDVIPIAVDAEGDHDFIVASELIYYIPGLGSIEAWLLEDLTLPGAVAYYEKSRGILLSGTFIYLSGMYNYTFELVSTNAFGKTLTITTPNSYTSWETDTSQFIYWVSTGLISNIKIELYKDDAFVMEITGGTLNDGLYSWTIPSTLDSSTQYQIKISDLIDPSVYDFSDYFEINTPASGPEIIPGYNLFVLIGLIGVISVIIVKNRKKT
ncbi:MAG: CARDB domain-containing protein [Promethearchaeota archaeon]